jgi:hypothetical protein
MDVRMMLQGLAPGVKNHGHTELGAEMPGIGRDGGECLGRRAEQDRVDDGLVLERDLADRCRQCEDDMKVRHRQQFGLPIREPLGPRPSLAFGTVTDCGTSCKRCGLHRNRRIARHGRRGPPSGTP